MSDDDNISKDVRLSSFFLITTTCSLKNLMVLFDHFVLEQLLKKETSSRQKRYFVKICSVFNFPE